MTKVFDKGFGFSPALINYLLNKAKAFSATIKAQGKKQKF